MAELRHYKYFVEVARRGSFTKAAASLYLTQSALSEQIQHLEQEFGCRLFDRGRHGARLTPDGEALLEMAEQLLRHAAEIERTARTRRLEPREVFRIGVTMSPLLIWLPEALADMQREHPNLDVFLEDAITPDLFLHVSTGNLDLAILSVAGGSEHGLESAGLVLESLVEDDWVVLVPKDHPFVALGTISLPDLRNDRLIVFPRNFSLRTVMDDLCRRSGVTLRPVVETGWLEMALRFVAAGVGITVVPRAVTLLDHPGVVAVEIAEREGWQRTMVAVYRHDSPRLPVIEDILRTARGSFARLTSEDGWRVGVSAGDEPIPTSRREQDL